MGEFDQSSELKVVAAQLMVGYAANSTGITVDTKNFGSLTFVINSGIISAGTMDFVMQEAPDDGTGSAGAFSNAVSTDIIGTLPTIIATDDHKLYRVGYNGKMRFVRLNSVETVSYSGFNMNCIAVLGTPNHIPVTEQNS